VIHKGFKRDISIGDQQFRFLVNDQTYIVVITKKGYNLIIFEESDILHEYKKMNLDKLNTLLPKDMQITKDHIIYILTADKDI